MQYSSANWKPCVQLVSRVWDTLLPDEPLFPGSPAAFRFRWDALLRHLNVSKTFQLTPASHRSGGAVAAHRRQVPINDLMRQMRVTHQKTLTHYLQEVAAMFSSTSAACECEIKHQAAQGALDAPILTNPRLQRSNRHRRRNRVRRRCLYQPCGPPRTPASVDTT